MDRLSDNIKHVMRILKSYPWKKQQFQNLNNFVYMKDQASCSDEYTLQIFVDVVKYHL